MLRDERGLALSTDSPEAAQLLDRAVEHFLKYRADVMSVAGRMLAGDPEFVMGHCFKGYMLLGASNPAHRPALAEAVKAAEAGAAVTTGRERRHVAALAAWAGGHLDTSFAIWREILDADPTDLLALRICDTTRFRHGQTAKVLEQADRVAPGWSPELPGYDLMQCVWAFAHEEAGDTRGAEPVIDAAHAVDPTNLFTHHVKAHIFEMECRPREGRDWLAGETGNWPGGNQMIHHLWWHRALMELELGELGWVLESYDTNIRNLDEPMTKAMPDNYVDLQNAVALLWRLEQLGVDVGDRWRELGEKAKARIGDTGHLLLVPHLLMALAATGQSEAADRFLAVLRAQAADKARWTAPAIADVVIPVCEAALAHRRGQYARAVELLELRQQQIRLLGGSNAQRDLFFQLLIDAAMNAGRRDVVGAMIAHETTTRAVPPGERVGYAAAARWLN